jgi:hypothetical protein
MNCNVWRAGSQYYGVTDVIRLYLCMVIVIESRSVVERLF